MIFYGLQDDSSWDDLSLGTSSLLLANMPEKYVCSWEESGGKVDTAG